MLIYVQLFGSHVNKTLALDLHSDDTIGELEKRILQLVKHEVLIKRCLFAGKQLDEKQKTIGQPT